MNPMNIHFHIPEIFFLVDLTDVDSKVAQVLFRFKVFGIVCAQIILSLGSMNKIISFDKVSFRQLM